MAATALEEGMDGSGSPGPDVHQAGVAGTSDEPRHHREGPFLRLVTRYRVREGPGLMPVASYAMR